MKKKKKQDNFAKPPLSQSTTKGSITGQGSSFNIFQHLLPVLLISILSLAIYANTLKNGFVYDDDITIVNNSFIKDIGNLPKLFQKDYFNLSGETSYRPIVTATYFFDYAISGSNPSGYHLTNILLHTINGLLLYLFLSLVIKCTNVGNIPLSLPLIGSFLFVTHPVLTEAINCISFREDLLTFLFYIVALILYLLLRLPEERRPFSWMSDHYLYFLSCICYILALFSKEMAVTFPLVVLCWEWLYKREESSPRSIFFNLYNFGYISITLFYAYIWLYLFPNPLTDSYPEWWNLKVRLFTLPLLIINYIKLTLFPVSLAADHVLFPVKSLFSTSFIMPLTTIMLLTVFFMLSRHFTAFGFLFFLITLIPVYNIVPIFNPLAERYLYLPIVGFVMVLAFVTRAILTTVPRNGHFIYLLLLLIIGVNSTGVIRRNLVWRDNHSLWSDTVKKNQYSIRAFNGLGNFYYSQGQFDDAIKSFLTAVRLNPDNAKTHLNLGLAYAKKNLLDEAIKHFIISIRLKPNDPKAHFALGTAYDKKSNFDEAVKEFKFALTQKPDYAEAHFNLGTVYYKVGRLNEAIQEYLKALSLKPNFADACFNLGSAYASLGRLDKAIEQYRTALQLKPNDPDIMSNLEQASVMMNLKNKPKSPTTLLGR